MKEFGNGQILDTPRPQPWPLSIPEIGKCCTYIPNDINNSDEITELSAARFASCISSSSVTNVDNSLNSNIVITTYSAPAQGYFGIKDIALFGAYQSGLVAAYAEHHNYSLRILNENTNSNYFPVDVRWNKVQILLNALNTYAKNSKYIVWIDSDAIILDLGLNIEEIGNQYPKAHLIASADIRQGYINSGFLIFKKSSFKTNNATK